MVINAMRPFTQLLVFIPTFLSAAAATAFTALPPSTIKLQHLHHYATTPSPFGLFGGGGEDNNDILHHRPHYHRFVTKKTALDSSIANSDASIFDDNNDSSSSSNSNAPVATKPRLARAIETTARWIIRHVFVRQCASLAVNVDASSNRAILRGKIDNLSISARDCIFRFDLFSFKRWDVAGVDLRLGCVPFALPLLPFAIWRCRRLVWLAFVGAQVLKLTGYNANAAEELGYSRRRSIERAKERVYRTLGARPSAISYSLAVAGDDVDGSLALRFWMRSVLRSLVENSVVGAAAAVGDAVIREQRQQSPRGVAMLPSSNAGSNGGVRGLMNFSQQQRGLTSTLLSATKFELKNTSFSDGRIVLQAEAVMPKDEANGQELGFTIRAKIQPTSVAEGQLTAAGGNRGQRRQQQQQQQKDNALGFFSPECRVNTDPLIAGTLLGKLIPDVVWLPFGAGVAVPLGKRCRIHRAEVAAEKYNNDDRVFRVDGSLAIFRTSQ